MGTTPLKPGISPFRQGVTAYSHEPYTLQNTLQYGGKFYVCGNRTPADPAKQDGE